MAKTKLRWDFPPLSEIHEEQIFIDPKSLQLLPAPIVVRNCLHGYNEQGNLIKILYCSRNVRFFTHHADGWHEQMPDTCRARRDRADRTASDGGNFDLIYMRNFGNRRCPRLIAYAWCEWPKEAETDPLWYKRYECDHLNGNHSDSSPENLRWLTPEQNIAWAKRQRAMRKLGLDLRHIPYTLLLHLSDLSDLQFETFLTLLQETFAADKRQLTLDNINFDIAHTLDWIISHTIRCARCGCEMISDTDEHHTHAYGTLCDCCYHELYT